MREPRRTVYTEIFVDTPRLRMPFLKTIIQFGRDEQVLSLNDKSFFVVVDLPFTTCARFIFLTRLFQHAFHPSDIAAQIMLFLVNNFMPPSPLLNAVNRTLGIVDYGSGFLDVRGFVGAP